MKRALSVFLIVLIGVTFGAGQSRLAQQFSDTFARVVEEVNPAVVTITSEKIVKREGADFGIRFKSILATISSSIISMLLKGRAAAGFSVPELSWMRGRDSFSPIIMWWKVLTRSLSC